MPTAIRDMSRRAILAGLLFALAYALPGAPNARAFPPGTEIVRDLAYGPDPAQTMDVYLPDVIEGAPVILMVHGGAWRLGDKRERSVVANKARRFLAEGIIFVSANYRLAPQADPLEQAKDVARALAAAQNQAVEWGGDPKRFVLMGHSSGGHLVALLGADPEIAVEQGAQRWLGTVSLDGGGYDIEAIMRARHPSFYDRAFGGDPALWKAASPVARLSGDPVPMLLVCSTLSRYSCAGARSFAQQVETAGGRAEVLPVAKRHMAINDELGIDETYTAGVDDFLRSLGLP